MQDDRTTNFNLPKPSTANILTDDVARLRSALDLIDAAIAGRATAADVTSQLAALIGSAPTTLDTLKELADAIGNDPSFATNVAANIASLQSALSSLAASGVSYNGAASGISATTVQGAIDYLKNIAGAGSGGSAASYTRQKFTATAGQTTFTTSGYTVGYLEVFLNGVLLDITDYTAVNGSTVVLATGAAAGDELVTIALDSFNIANILRVIVASASAPAGAISIGADGGVTFKNLQAVQAANFTATAGNSYPVNTTSGSVRVTLPASPIAGQQVTVFDYAGTAATNLIAINPNGAKINGASGSVFISTNRASVTLTYVDSTQGWVDVAIGNTAYIQQGYSASYLVIAGGGGSANPYITDPNTCGGGGGAGGVLSGTASLTAGTVYSITVGAGGAGNSGVDQGGSGGSSVFNGLTAIGGGGGGRQSRTGGNGGSGGGGNLASGGSGTTGQGYAGGSGLGTTALQGGGGGGAGAIGSNSGYDNGVGGNGGIGIASSITGSSTYYAGGGGGAGTVAGGTGGSGGGGAGTSTNLTSGSAGSSNTGGGAGGSRSNVIGANGGSGVVILSVPTVAYSGITTGSPTVTTSGSNTIIKFTSSGSYTA